MTALQLAIIAATEANPAATQREIARLTGASPCYVSATYSQRLQELPRKPWVTPPPTEWGKAFRAKQAEAARQIADVQPRGSKQVAARKAIAENPRRTESACAYRQRIAEIAGCSAAYVRQLMEADRATQFGFEAQAREDALIAVAPSMDYTTITVEPAGAP